MSNDPYPYQPSSLNPSSHSGQSNSSSYPEPDADFEDIYRNPQIFADKLHAFHRSFGEYLLVEREDLTGFYLFLPTVLLRVPTIGGKTLDLHRLFVEVTSRGGIEKVIRDRKWKEIGQAFNFPSTITSASFVLRKFYLSLLYHFEQVYYLRKRAPSTIADESISRITNGSPALNFLEDGATMSQFSENPDLEAGSSVTGTIDAKFESGYLITVNVGSETLQGVLYHTPTGSHMSQSSNNPIAAPPHQRKRKRHQLALRDSSRPKANRNGYNFFFAEQYAKLKPLYHGQEKAISNKIVLLWSRLSEDEKRDYQEKERSSTLSQAQ
ncbi:hypothetical protein LguiB_030294 [Lonicera macranthoides]